MKLCSFSMCTELVLYGQKHCIKHEHMDKERHKEYQRHRTDKREQAFYNSKEWKLVRQQVLIRDNRLCQLSLLDNKIVFADMVHHIIPMKEDESKKLDMDNLISLSNGMHNYVENEYDKGATSKEKMQELLRKIVLDKG